MTHTTVPIASDRALIHRLAVLAAIRQTTIGTLVREAVDAHLGAALEALDPVLVANGVTSVQQSELARNAGGAS